MLCYIYIACLVSLLQITTDTIVNGTQKPQSTACNQQTYSNNTKIHLNIQEQTPASFVAVTLGVSNFSYMHVCVKS